ncbi:MAG TPA: glutamyl-tRNA reductase [Terriglobales bacterium]|nr:glutamyl-tRNA reductase [Candidatus Sulfotelmatobacter sp.]HYW37656.1 glutamyl-tRNA reductase [Terriglobales bacterium]
MEPSLMVVGLNYRTAPVAVRERFWISENRRYEALVQLSRAEGIEEVIVMATCNRTEFWLWAPDVTLAANSVMRLLGAEYGLKLCEWKHFYRLLDEAALLHIFRVASSLDSMVVGEPQVVSQVKEAGKQAQKVGATGRFLDAVLQKALTVSERVRSETAIGNAAVSIPYAAVELARQIFGTLENKKVLLLGAGEMSELSARELLNHGGGSVRVSVINRTLEHAVELAAKLGGLAIPFEERWQHMAEADIIISSTSCPHTILSREEAEFMVRGRKENDRPLVIADLAMPRNVDPAVRNVKGVFLYDLDDLENVTDHNASEREAAAADAQKILQAEAQGFRGKLMAERVVPTIVALRLRLNEICRQELDSFREENGPFSKDQDEMLNAVMSRMTQRIAGSLARELKELPEKVEQEQMTTALRRLFHLQTAEPAIPSTRP